MALLSYLDEHDACDRCRYKKQAHGPACVEVWSEFLGSEAIEIQVCRVTHGKHPTHMQDPACRLRCCGY